jgi:site-specific recombinase XerD
LRIIILKKKQLNQIPSKQDFIDAISKIHEPEPENKKKAVKSFLQYFQEFIDDRKRDEMFSEGTIRNYRTCLNHLKGFNTSKYKTKLEFEYIDQEFYNAFFSYTANKGISNASFGKNIRVIKTFMNYAKKKKWHNQEGYSEYLKDIKTESQSVYIDDSELELLENFEPESEVLKTVKDCFLIQLYTGIRYSDLVHLNSKNIDMNNKKVFLYSLKTDTPIIIPIHSRLEKIFLKYSNSPLRVLSNSKYNDYLKELCKIAGIDKEVQTVKKIGGKRHFKTHKKYELISSHTGRRSFITLSLKKGLLPEHIMKITGHKKRSTFQKYVKITQDESVEAVGKAWG